jgi:hypothetical protein
LDAFQGELKSVEVILLGDGNKGLEVGNPVLESL